MYPDYRTSAARRLDQLVPKLVIAAVLAAAALWVAIGFVVWHFVDKFW